MIKLHNFSYETMELTGMLKIRHIFYEKWQFILSFGKVRKVMKEKVFIKISHQLKGEVINEKNCFF